MPILEINKKVDWNFEKANHSENINSIHPYPAKFIPDIPRALIQKYGLKKGTALLDPFCGSGTALVEGARAKFPSVGIDLNPIACLISKVKTTHLPKDFSKNVDMVVGLAKENLSNAETRNIPNVDHWFKKDVQYALSAFTRAIEKFSNQTLKEHFLLALSSIIVKVSNQESDTRYAAIEKNVSSEIVFSSFVNACERLYRIKKKEILSTAPIKIINKNLFDVKPGEIEFPIGLVVTSPPYPNAYEYWLYHKYRMWWLGYDPLAVKRSEIGARAHFFKKNHHTQHTFKDQMVKTFSFLNKAVIKNGKICFIIGRSIIHGEIIDNGKIVESAATYCKFKCIDRITRTIALNRKSFNLSHARIKEEQILVFEK